MKFLKFSLLFLMISVISCKKEVVEVQQTNLTSVKKTYTYDEEQDITFPYQLNLASGVNIQDTYVTKNSCFGSQIIYEVSKDLKIKNYEIRCGKEVQALNAYVFKDSVLYFSEITTKKIPNAKTYTNSENTFILKDTMYLNYKRIEAVKDTLNPFGKGFTKNLELDKNNPALSISTYQKRLNPFLKFLDNK